MDKVGFVKLFCGNSNDKTVCPIHIKISESILLESFSFHTNFNSIYSDSDSETIALLREKIKNLMKGSYSQEDIYQMNDIDAIIKLEIIKNHLSQIEVYTRQDLVLCRYIGGLRQIAQYKILKLMGKEDTVAMDILREMPFCNSSESSAQDS